MVSFVSFNFPIVISYNEIMEIRMSFDNSIELRIDIIHDIVLLIYFNI